MNFKKTTAFILSFIIYSSSYSFDKDKLIYSYKSFNQIIIDNINQFEIRKLKKPILFCYQPLLNYEFVKQNSILVDKATLKNENSFSPGTYIILDSFNKEMKPIYYFNVSSFNKKLVEIGPLINFIYNYIGDPQKRYLSDYAGFTNLGHGEQQINYFHSKVMDSGQKSTSSVYLFGDYQQMSGEYRVLYDKQTNICNIELYSYNDKLSKMLILKSKANKLLKLTYLPGYPNKLGAEFRFPWYEPLPMSSFDLNYIYWDHYKKRNNIKVVVNAILDSEFNSFYYYSPTSVSIYLKNELKLKYKANYQSFGIESEIIISGKKCNYHFNLIHTKGHDVNQYQLINDQHKKNSHRPYYQEDISKLIGECII